MCLTFDSITLLAYSFCMRSSLYNPIVGQVIARELPHGQNLLTGTIYTFQQRNNLCIGIQGHLIE